MKDHSEATYRAWFNDPGVNKAFERIQFCLESLFKSKSVTMHDKVIKDSPVPNYGMDFEELIGALLAAEHHLKILNEGDEQEQEYDYPDVPENG